MDIVRHSKKLSWLLRHGAKETGLTMDAAGWAPIPEVLRHTRMTRATLEVIVAENNKQRLQVDGDRIRAVQGHSTEGTPVTAEALEASWERLDLTEPVFHGTHRSAAEAIRSEGILPMARTHVHLARTADAKVGKRHNVSVLVVVDPVRLAACGFPLFASPNGVLLARQVPAASIVGLRDLR